MDVGQALSTHEPFKMFRVLSAVLFKYEAVAISLDHKQLSNLKREAVLESHSSTTWSPETCRVEGRIRNSLRPGERRHINKDPLIL